eukprot:2214551-Amphidinium_carterae.1
MESTASTEKPCVEKAAAKEAVPKPKVSTDAVLGGLSISLDSAAAGPTGPSVMSVVGKSTQ